MEEIPNNHLGCINPPWEIYHTGAGLFPSTVWIFLLGSPLSFPELQIHKYRDIFIVDQNMVEPESFIGDTYPIFSRYYVYF